ncbi:MAG TPA: O-antigen ligase family protein [Gemmatimonadaceae bacterium]|nr:O-antigen ligase family protein [Gemmatimonadaceae bacterium]
MRRNVGQPRRGRVAGASAAQRERPTFARDPLRMALFALIVVSVGRVHKVMHIGFLHPAMLLFLIAAGCAALNPRLLVHDNVFRFWPAKVIAGLLIFACISAPFGLSLGASGMFILTDFAKVVVYTLLIMMVIRDASDLRMFIWAYVVSCAALVWMAVFIFRLQITGSGMARLSNMYTYDANDLGCVLVTGLPLTVLAFQASRRRGKIVCGILLAGIGLALARSGSRGAFLGLAVVGVAILVALKEVPVQKRIAFVGVMAVVLLLAAPRGYWEQMQTLLQPTQDYNWTSQTGRKEVWERGLGYMAKHPIFGLGISNFGRAEGTVSERARDYMPGEAGIKWTAPHNSFIEAGSELGIPGLILWSSLVLGGIVTALRFRKRLPESWLHGDRDQRTIYLTSVYLPIAFIGFAVTGFFVSFAWVDPIYILAAYMVALHRSAQNKLRSMSEAAPAELPSRRIRPPASPRARALRHGRGAR